MSKWDHSFPSESELIEGICRQDPEVFERFVRDYQNYVYYNALMTIGNREEAFDVMQDIFLKIWLSPDKASKVSNLRPWVGQITYRTCMDHLRRKQREKVQLHEKLENHLYLPIKTPGPREQTLHFEWQQFIETAMNDLTDRQRTIFKLRHFQQLTIQEIANRLGTPLGTVKATLHQSLIKMRRLLPAEVYKSLELDKQE